MKKNAKGLNAKLLLLTLAPVLLVGLILFFISTNKMETSLDGGTRRCRSSMATIPPPRSRRP